MAAAIRYCTTEDGVRIAYSVEGEGPVLLQCNSAWESFASERPINAVAFGPIRRGRRVIRYDFRGVGLSDRNVNVFTHDAMVRDLEAVIRSANLKRFDLLASTFSVPWAIEYAARHPDFLDRLVLSRGLIRASDVIPRENLDAIVNLITTNWEMASQMLLDQGPRGSSPEALQAAKQIRQDISAAATAQWLIDLYESTDVVELLPAIEASTLILHRIEDTVFPFSAAQEMAARMPRAQLVALPGAGPVLQEVDAGASTQTIIDFLDEGRPKSQSESDAGAAGAFRTVLFTDIVGHTAMMQRLGDAKGRDVLREHERITRDLLKRHGGAEVKTMGDGFMASFGSVTSAMNCAIALQRAFATHTESMPEPLHVRVGLNAGEPIEEDGDLFGATVILASRIAAKAGAGEILVPDTVRGLLSGKGFMFSDRGEFVPKGFDDAVRLYEVRWREDDR